MNSFCVGLFAVLTVFSGNALSKITHDRFEQLFSARASFPQMLAEVFDNDPAVQLQHLRTIQGHIDANDAYARYAKHLKSAAQEVLQGTLNDIGYEGDNINLEEFMETSYKVSSGEHIDNQELEQLVKTLLERKRQLSEASENEKNAQLDKLASKVKSGDEANTEN